MKAALERLNITDCDNEKAAITCNPIAQEFRVNFANWSVLIFNKLQTPTITLALLENDAAGLGLENVHFEFKSGEPKINLYQMSLEQFKQGEHEIRPVLLRTMDEIALRFGHHQKM